MQTNSLLLAAFSISAVACGGGGGRDTGGVDGNTQLTALTAADAVKLCNAITDDYPSKLTTCPGDSEPSERGTASANDCSTAMAPKVNSSCTATLTEFLDCFDALYDETDAQYCDKEYLPPECTAVVPCFVGARKSEIRDFALGYGATIH